MKAVVTDPCLVLSLDLYTVKPSDLAFTAPFTLTCRRNDYIHALIAWFDIDFGACHKPIKFSTGPHAKYTHWKQTVFYLDDVLTVKNGEELQGVLSSKPSEKNRRDLDVKIQYSFNAEDRDRAVNSVCLYKMSVFLEVIDEVD